MKKFAVFLLFLVTSALSGQNPGELMMKAKALVDTGRPDEAVSVLNEALAKAQGTRLYLLRAEAYMARGDYSSAIRDLNSANDIDPLSGEYGLARIYAIRGDGATAVYHLERSMRSGFKRSEKEILLDPSFSLLENRTEWRQFWKKDWYSTLEKGVAEIEYNISTGDFTDAKALLREISTAYPGDEKVLYSTAVINLAESKYPDATRILTELHNQYPENESYLRLLAKAQTMAGNNAGASVSLTRLIDLNVPDPELLVERAECYKKTGETERAISDIEKYLSLYPGSKKALSLAGKIESAAGDNMKALSYFSDNVRLHPNDPECYIDRANSYFVSRSWNWAAQDYSMSLDLQPGNPDVWLNKGISLINLGKTEDACHDFRKSFNLGNRKATEYLSKYCIK
jgi:Flp pilus assembly protein TadD